MAFVEKTAKTVEEAVAAALSELNITAEEAVIEVLEEGKKGLFGFFGKDAKVRVTAKEVVVEETVVETAAPEAAPVVETVVETEVKEEAPVATEERVAREPKKFVVSDESVAKAREFLQKVFNAMKIDVVMEKFVNKNDGTVTFKLHGADMGILIGKHGQTLDSLQYLTNLVANKNSAERVRVIIDVEDYRDRRIETLNRLAYRLADKVKRSGERVALEPMNPHERKIIHMALQNDRRVTTLSEGDEPFRHVVIELKK
ncbi:MAG: protein jag [Phascolarctobacterium sp.]|nr:protein jag [Phascolarctobacterium sp.]MBR5486410.1 protein jag [Phascolarctobacterium sp.]MBR6511477.1 protein jag [Phascolarctobacterium sp.]